MAYLQPNRQFQYASIFQYYLNRIKKMFSSTCVSQTSHQLSDVWYYSTTSVGWALTINIIKLVKQTVGSIRTNAHFSIQVARLCSNTVTHCTSLPVKSDREDCFHQFFLSVQRFNYFTTEPSLTEVIRVSPEGWATFISTPTPVSVRVTD